MQFYLGVAAICAVFGRRGPYLVPALALAIAGIVDAQPISVVTWHRAMETSHGNVLLLDSRGCLVRNELDVPLAVADATDLIVIVSPSGSLVMPVASAQKAGLIRDRIAESKH
jgi:hypothetical protein